MKSSLDALISSGSARLDDLVQTSVIFNDEQGVKR